MNRNLKLMFALVMVFSFVLGACAPAAAPATAVKPVATAVPPTPIVIEVTKIVQAPAATAAPQADRVQIYWYIGLGAGSQPAQIPLEKAFADKFNASQTKIQLIPIIVDNRYARDNLTAQLAADNAPDIVGPVGTAGRAAFPGQFLDLQPLIDKTKYDTGGIDPAFFNFYKVEGKLVGLPFAIFPSAVFVNKELFKQAGLNLPPQKVGEQYVWADGTKEDWSFDTVAKVARKLTIDKNGNDATSTKFDAKNIVQWGFNMQWNDDPRAFGSYFCANYPVGPDGKALIPDCWKAAWQWYYDAIWGAQPFMPNQAAIDSDLLKGNAFSSGKVAMGETHLWYTCCVDTKNVTSLGVGIVPSYNGKLTSKLHGDTFDIMAKTKHPDEAWEVYQYMLTAGAAELYAIYGGLPAKTADQGPFLAGLTKTYGDVNWQVFLDMIPYLDAPNHELGLPNNTPSNDAFNKLGGDLRSNPKLDVAKRIEEFITELNGLYAAAPK